MQRGIAFLSSAALLSGAFFLDGAQQTIYVVGFMLLAPLLDKSAPSHSHTLFNARYMHLYIVLCSLTAAASVYGGFGLYTVSNNLLTAALPEEYFFRVYLLGAYGLNYIGNIVSSCIFSLLHVITRDWLTGAAVLMPSLVYGYIYIRYRDLLLLVLAHLASNIVFMNLPHSITSLTNP